MSSQDRHYTTVHRAVAAMWDTYHRVIKKGDNGDFKFWIEEECNVLSAILTALSGGRATYEEGFLAGLRALCLLSPDQSGADLREWSSEVETACQLADVEQGEMQFHEKIRLALEAARRHLEPES